MEKMKQLLACSKWKYLLTPAAQGKMWGSERKPDWLEMFSKFSELKL